MGQFVRRNILLIIWISSAIMEHECFQGRRKSDTAQSLIRRCEVGTCDVKIIMVIHQKPGVRLEKGKSIQLHLCERGWILSGKSLRLIMQCKTLSIQRQRVYLIKIAVCA